MSPALFPPPKIVAYTSRKEAAAAWVAQCAAIQDMLVIKTGTVARSWFLGANVADKKALFVIPEHNDNLYLSLRNIPNAASTLLSDINTYDIVNADVLVLTESAARIFAEDEKAVGA